VLDLFAAVRLAYTKLSMMVLFQNVNGHCQAGQMPVITFAYRDARAVDIVRCAFDNCGRFCAVQLVAAEETVKPRNIK
jgi:hypothetical protein